MPLHHEQEVLSPAGGRNQTATSGPVSLTSDELPLLMRRAMAHHRSAQQEAVERSEEVSLAEALEIAHQLGIPEEHVLAAAEELPEIREREQLRQEIRKQRRCSALYAVTGTAASSAFGLGVGLAVTFATGSWWGLIVVASLQLVACLFAAGWAWHCLRRPITEKELDRIMAASRERKSAPPADTGDGGSWYWGW